MTHVLCRATLQEGTPLSTKSLLYPDSNPQYYFEGKCSEINTRKPKLQSKFMTRINRYFLISSHLCFCVGRTWTCLVWSSSNKTEGKSGGWSNWLTAKGNQRKLFSDRSWNNSAFKDSPCSRWWAEALQAIHSTLSIASRSHDHLWLWYRLGSRLTEVP